MGSKAVVAAVAVTLVAALGFVVLGATYAENYYGVAAILAAVAFGAAMVGVMSVLVSLVGTVQQLTRTVESLTEEAVPLLSGVSETVSGVNTELARVDAIVGSAQHVAGRAEQIADLVHAAVANPIIKTMAFFTGAKVALRTARGR